MIEARCNLYAVAVEQSSTDLPVSTWRPERLHILSRHASLTEAGRSLSRAIGNRERPILNAIWFVMDARDGRTWSAQGALAKGFPIGLRLNSAHTREAVAYAFARLKAPRYKVASFDLCGGGFERLRSPSEFILTAHPRHRDGWRALRSQWLQDMGTCDQGEGFDYLAARAAVASYCEALRETMAGRNLRATFGDFAQGTEEEEGCTAFLYVRDTWADLPQDMDEAA